MRRGLDVLGAICASVALLFTGEVAAHESETFDQNYDARLAAGSRVSALAVQRDGKLLVAGDLRFEERSRRFTLVRLETDGRMDAAFYPPGFLGVASVALQPDGRFIVSGKLPTAAGATNNPGGVVRLNPDGTLDETFNSRASVGEVLPHAIAVQTIGRTNFTIVADALLDKSWPRAVRRLLPDGSLDRAFATNGFLSLGLGGFVSKIYVQSNGKILVGGSFEAFGGVPRRSILRLNHNGSLDKFFDPGALLWSSYGLNGATGTIIDILYDPPRSATGTIYVAARGIKASGEAVGFVAGFAGATGSLGLQPYLEATNGTIAKLAPSGTSDIFVAGEFATQTPRKITNIRRLGDFSFDPHFEGFAPPPFEHLVATDDGYFYVGGAFVASPGFPRNALARFHSVGAEFPVVIEKQPESLQIETGAEAVFSVDFATRFVNPLAYQWLFNDRPIPGATNRQLAIPFTTAADAGNYRVRISQPARREVVSVAAALSFVPARNGSVDPDFQPPEQNGVAELNVRNLIPTPLGGVWAARAITMRDGPTRQEIVEFDSSGAEARRIAFAAIESFERGADGSLLVLGALGEANRRLMRFDASGSLDGTFAPTINAGARLHDFTLQADGRILIYGAFTSVNGEARTNIARLFDNGQVDPSFASADVPEDRFASLHVLESGEIVIGHSFGILLRNDGTQSARRISFPPFLRDGLVELPDARLLIAAGNALSSMDGVDFRCAVAQVAPDWRSFDEGFRPAVNLGVYALATQPDGKVILGGDFSTVNGMRRHGFARLMADGSLDAAFHRGLGLARSPGGSVQSVALGSDGKVWVAGTFDRVDGFRRPGIARLLGDVAPFLEAPMGENSGAWRFRVQPFRGREQRLEYRDSLDEPWRLLRMIPAGEVREIEDAAVARQRFYRLRAE